MYGSSTYTAETEEPGERCWYPVSTSGRGEVKGDEEEGLLIMAMWGDQKSRKPGMSNREYLAKLRKQAKAKKGK